MDFILDSYKIDVLGRLFSSVFTDEPDGTIPRIPYSLLKEIMGLLVISEDAIRTKMCSLNVNKSSGPKGTHPRILHELRNQLCNMYTVRKVGQKALSSGALPAEWKEGLVSTYYGKSQEWRPKTPRYQQTLLLYREIQHVEPPNICL